VSANLRFKVKVAAKVSYTTVAANTVVGHYGCKCQFVSNKFRGPIAHGIATDELLCLKNVGTQTSMFFTSNEYSAPTAIKKNQNPGGRFGVNS
jgi:hypothetical protein